MSDEPIFYRNDDDTVRAEWPDPLSEFYPVSTELLKQWVEDKNELVRLRQGLWDVYGALGFDRDGDATPRAHVHPPLEVLVLDAANEYRTDTENEAKLLEAENGELRRELARVSLYPKAEEPQ